MTAVSVLGDWRAAPGEGKEEDDESERPPITPFPDG
jgi:hypothetical protein